jgi:predicted nucleic acid-binding Zn ribbon protein
MEEEKGPETLKEVLSRMLLSRGWGQQQERLHLEQAWTKAVGEAAAEKAVIGSYAKGVLEIVVRDAVLLHKLANFEKRSLLKSLQAALGQGRVMELRFRLGVR